MCTIHDDWAGTNAELYVCDECKADSLKIYYDNHIDWIMERKV